MWKTETNILTFLLSVLLSCGSCTNNHKDSEKKISPEAVRISSLFKSGKYTDENGFITPYRYFEPSDHAEGSVYYPLILYLHGEEERGSDNKIQITTTECATTWAEPDHLAKNPVYVLAPQAPEETVWTDELVYGDVLSLLKQFIKSHPDIDTRRIYITGFSMGATGVWNMILKNPGLFAGALPISGNAESFLGNHEAFAALKNMPVLVVHSSDDPISPVSGSNNAIAALQAAGNRCVGSNSSIWGSGSVIPPHNAWYPAFHNYEVIYNWLFEQSLERTGNGTISPTTLFTILNHGNGIKEIWDYALGTAYVIEKTDKAVIIDVAAGDGNIFRFIKDKVLENKDIDIEIMITHNHGDHIGGLPSFSGSSQVKKIYVNKEDSDLVKMMLGTDSVKVQYIDDGDAVALGSKSVEVIHVPGHSFGSVVMRYENNLFTGDAIGSGDVWLGFSPYSVEDYIQSVQHLLDKTGNEKLNIMPGHSGECRSPLTEEYIHQMLSCAKGIVDGSITSMPYRRTIGGQSTIGHAATYGRATIVYNLNNVRTIKGALRNITISHGTLSPRFAPYTTYYTANVNEDIPSVKITPSVLVKNYLSLKINGTEVFSGEPFEASLNKGGNVFSIEVTTPDKTTKIYTVRVIRSNQAALTMRF